jgi:hypothetical protein
LARGAGDPVVPVGDGSAASALVATAAVKAGWSRRRCVVGRSVARSRGAVAARRMHSAARLHVADRITIAVPPVARLVAAARISVCVTLKRFLDAKSYVIAKKSARGCRMSGGAPSKLLQFLAAGAIVAVSSWDVHRKIRANSVPVTAEQWEDINQWKRDQKREIEQGRSFRVLEYLSKGGGGEEEG